MQNQVQRSCSFRFEIDNFSKKEYAIHSLKFVSGGYQWYLYVGLKGDRYCDDHLSLFLRFAEYESLLGYGRKKSPDVYFVVLNQSDKELYRSPITSSLQISMSPGWGFKKTLPLSKLQEKGILEKDKLIVEVYINVELKFLMDIV